MSEGAGMEDVYAAVEESARLLDVTCSRDRVWPILTAYEDALAEAVIVCSMATGEHNAGELDYTITIPAAQGDPYAVALATGLTGATDHPVGALLAGIRAQCPIGGYAVDCGVVGGFKKTYSFFPTDDLQGLAKLSGIPSMPRSLAGNAGFFLRHGLDDHVTMLSIDYLRKTVNLYFGKLPGECLEPEAILSMLGDMGLPEPSGQTMDFIQKSFAVYVTLSWESPDIERICFAVITQDPVALPARLHPEIERFARSAPRSSSDVRTLVYGVTLSPGGEYYKLGSYYQINAQTRGLLVAFDAFKDRV